MAEEAAVKLFWAHYCCKKPEHSCYWLGCKLLASDSRLTPLEAVTGLLLLVLLSLGKFMYILTFAQTKHTKPTFLRVGRLWSLQNYVELLSLWILSIFQKIQYNVLIKKGSSELIQTFFITEEAKKAHFSPQKFNSHIALIKSKNLFKVIRIIILFTTELNWKTNQEHLQSGNRLRIKRL